MIDLTPLDVRKKHEDFKRILRGLDPQEVQTFLEMVAERMEELVRENLQLKERSESLQEQVRSQTGREQAVQDALVTAQELRGDIQRQAQKESELIIAEAQTEARRMMAEAEAEVRSLMRDAQRKLDQGVDALEEMERRRVRFLKAFRQLLEREMDVVEVEEARAPLEDRAVDMELGGGRAKEAETPAEAEAEVATEAEPPVAPAVDESAAEQPPLDAPIDELASSYGGDAEATPGDDPFANWDALQGASQEGGSGEGASGDEESSAETDPTLFSSVEEDEPEDGRWG